LGFILKSIIKSYPSITDPLYPSITDSYPSITDRPPFAMLAGLFQPIVASTEFCHMSPYVQTSFHLPARKYS